MLGTRKSWSSAARSRGSDLRATLLERDDDEVALENPGYLGARLVLQASGARLRPVRIDDGRARCRAASLGEAGEAGVRDACAAVPDGRRVAGAARRRSCSTGRGRRSAVIVEDDYDSEYRYSGARCRRYTARRNDVAVIYCGSFSKVMFPGLRIGYLQSSRSRW